MSTAILLVEQFVAQALRLASRAYVLEKGRVAFDGDAGELAGQGTGTYYLGRETQAREKASADSRRTEQVTVGVPGGLWRDLEIVAAKAGRNPGDLVLDAIRSAATEAGNGRAPADTKKGRRR